MKFLVEKSGTFLRQVWSHLLYEINIFFHLGKKSFKWQLPIGASLYKVWLGTGLDKISSMMILFLQDYQALSLSEDEHKLLIFCLPKI